MLNNNTKALPLTPTQMFAKEMYMLTSDLICAEKSIFEYLGKSFGWLTLPALCWQKASPKSPHVGKSIPSWSHESPHVLQSTLHFWSLRNIASVRPSSRVYLLKMFCDVVVIHSHLNGCSCICEGKAGKFLNEHGISCSSSLWWVL